ncbi:M3 family metallopeptidase [Glutamicibacter sp. X7]
MPNPLLTRSSLPFQWPDFSAITPENYLEAVKAGIAEQRDAIAYIVADPTPADFENTVLALELSGETLRRALMTYFSVLSADGTEEIRALQEEISALYAAQMSEIHLNGELYARLCAVPTEELSGEDARLVHETLKSFKLAGAELEPEAKDQLRELDAEIAACSTNFSAQALENQNAHAVYFESAEELAGLDAGRLATARQAAADTGHEQGYLLALVSPTQQPVLQSLESSAARRRVFEASISRGLEGNNNTYALAVKMAELRAQRAQLLGYANHAESVLATATAPDTAAVAERLAELTAPAVRNALSETATLRELAGEKIEAWDWTYYSNKVLAQRYAVDTSALREYFELERVLHQGVFAAATKLYGITFSERTDLPVYHESVRVWEVRNEDGSVLGLYSGDYLARPTKKGGAWMTSLRDAASAVDELPVVTNTLNISPAAPGEPVLLSLDETRTLFHEFGHALHGLFSNGRYPSLSGTSVPRDFVEFPSQVNEMWALHPQILPDYAVHYRTGEPLDPQVVKAIEDSALWGEGFATTEYLAASVLDWAWHTLEPGAQINDPVAFENQVLVEAGFIPELIPPRYRTGYFQHIFANGYSAGYYSYIWSEVLDADTVEWFTENGGLMRENGNRFREELLSRGNTRDPLESYELFRGRSARVEPLLRRRGLVNAE